MKKSKEPHYEVTPIDPERVLFECEDANIKQEFLVEDVPALIADLPNLVENEHTLPSLDL